MDKAESKFYNAALKMNDALFKLLEFKEFTDITITDICKEANVNRTTFYAHYENTNDLLQEAKDRIMNKFFNFFGNETRHIDLNNFHPESFISDKFIVPYLNFVKDNKKIFKIFYNNLNTFNTKEIYDLLLERLWIPICNKKGLNDLSIINYMSKFFLNGMTSIIIEWINNNCEDDIYFICEIIILCVRPSEDF